MVSRPQALFFAILLPVNDRDDTTQVAGPSGEGAAMQREGVERVRLKSGHEMAYRRAGSGEPVLLVHGITTYSFLWRKYSCDQKKKSLLLSVLKTPGM